MATSVAAALGASVPGQATANEGATNAMVKGEIKRFATTALGAEVTGPFVFDDGSLIFSLQHPSRDNQPPYKRGAIGMVTGHAFGEGEDFEELSVPKTKDEQERVRTAAGEYDILAQEGDVIDGGKGRLGVPETPDGQFVDSFAGSRYGNFGFNPDCNQFVATNDGDTDGFLFTNFEQSPGEVSRIPMRKTGDGSWEADLANAINLANTEPMRELGGTRINCYGDRSPWGTMLSAEEDYSHTRVSLTATVSDVVDRGGVGRRGASEFWNRPNPSGIQEKVGEYYDEGWYVQGYFALTGVEIQAYYLGADPVDQTREEENNTAPIDENYPNRYRFGYIVDFREPAADPPQPVKYYVMGRAAWEAPNVMNDNRTVYLTSDGANKGIYKFVAEEPIPSYDDPMDVAGTLYAPEVTNREAARNNPPGKTNLEIRWMELGFASNREVAQWIADYDDVTQVDYLESHSDWTRGQPVTEDVLEEADREVVENGNRDYITDREILQWAEEYDSAFPSGVPQSLRRVPFLETRAAAKEIGATIEFRKAEGIDARSDAGPGDYVYIGLSEINDGLVDDEGDIQMQQVDGGAVYRAEIEGDYNISTLEPVVVGPNASDPANIADDALLNIDNVYVMENGKVLCCEDADQLGRSYKNDGLYVYDPES
jgi:secreted PhoX family phosphatase